MPEHLRVLSDRTLYASARAKLRSYAVAVVRYLQDRPGRTARVRQIGRELFGGSEGSEYLSATHRIFLAALGPFATRAGDTELAHSLP